MYFFYKIFNDSEKILLETATNTVAFHSFGVSEH